MSEKPKFFKTPAAFRKWLANNHDRVDAQWVGYYKVASDRTSITWPESVEEALCFGWIDGLRKKVDDEAYKVRFTPRREGSVWSAKNIGTGRELIDAGRMQPPGMRAYDKRTENKSSGYSYAQATTMPLSKDYEQRFRNNGAAWAYYEAQAPWYRRTSAFWVMSAKKAETRERRLAQLIEDSEQERPIPPLARKKG